MTRFLAWIAGLIAVGTVVVATMLVVGEGGDGGSEAGVADARLRVADYLAGDDTAGYARADSVRSFTFPRDHGPHPDFRTEWWYVTGNVETPAGRRFGYQFTIFRSALSPEAPEGPSAWRTRQAYMAHLAVTDVEAGTFHSEERFARGAVGMAGADTAPLRVWVDDQSLTTANTTTDPAAAASSDAASSDASSSSPAGAAPPADPAFPLRIQGALDGVELDLTLQRGKPPVFQGEDGLSAKGPEPGNASYYYSLTRMPTTGWLLIDGAGATSDTLVVSGLSWMDREWSTSALGPGVEGWDWFSLQLDDGHDLMFYRLRREDGSATPESSGSWVEPDGTRRAISGGEIILEPLEWWESPDGDARYPIRWRILWPAEELDLTVNPVMPHQEWTGAFRYWEGAVDVSGTRGGALGGASVPVGGRGYVELTGYGGTSLSGLR